MRILIAVTSLCICCVASSPLLADRIVTTATSISIFANVVNEDPGSVLETNQFSLDLATASIEDTISQGATTAEVLARVEAYNTGPSAGFVFGKGDYYKIDGGPLEFDTVSGIRYEGSADLVLQGALFETAAFVGSTDIEFSGELAVGDTLRYSIGHVIRQSNFGGSGGLGYTYAAGGTITTPGPFSIAAFDIGTPQRFTYLPSSNIPLRQTATVTFQFNKRGEGHSWVELDPDFGARTVPEPSPISMVVSGCVAAFLFFAVKRA